VKGGPWKNFQGFKRDKERQKQGAQIFDAKGIRCGMLSSAITPVPLSHSMSPTDSVGFGGKNSRYSIASFASSVDSATFSQMLSQQRFSNSSRCTTATPATPDLLEDSSCGGSRPGTRQETRGIDAQKALDIEKDAVSEAKFLEIVLNEQIKYNYWESYTDAGCGKNAISDWEEHMRKVQEEMCDEEIVDRDLISCFNGFTLKTPREELISAYERQCRETFSLPLGPRQRALQGPRKESCAAQLSTPEILQYQGWGLGSDRLDMLCETAGPGLQGCRHCNLSGNRIQDRSIPRLCTQLLPTIETLDLSQNALGRQGARHLANGLKALRTRAPLLELNLEENRLGEVHEQDACALVEALSAFCPQLRGLSLAKNGLGKESGSFGKTLGNMVATATNLKVLDLHWNMFGGFGAYQLLTGIYENGQHDGCLTRLDLSWNRLGYVDPSHKALAPFKVLADIFEDHKYLFHLDISYNQLKMEACECLAESIKGNHTLFGLHIAGNEASVDSNGFIIPHQNPHAIKPPLINQDPFLKKWQREAETSEKVLRSRYSGLSVGSSRRLSAKYRKSRCTNFIETSQGTSTDEDQHCIGLLETIGDHPLDSLKLRAECCWICDRWRTVLIVWTPGVSGPLRSEEVQHVSVFLSIDSFRRATALHRCKPKTACSTQETWEAHFMLPPNSKTAPLLAVFQVNGGIAIANDMQKRMLAEPIVLCPTNDSKQTSAVSIPGQLSYDSSNDDEKELWIKEANELPLPEQHHYTRHKQPLVVTEDLLEHGKVAVFPRTVDKTRVKPTKKWTKAVSVWAQWVEEFDSVNHIEKMLDYDIYLSKVSKIATDADETQIKQAIQPFYPMLMSAYRVLAAQGSGHSIFGMNVSAWVSLCNKCDLLDDNVTQKDLAHFTLVSSVVDKRHAHQIRVRDDKVNVRYQFVETLCRFAHAKYVEFGHAQNTGQALTLILGRMQDYLSDFRKDIEAFRAAYFVEEVDLVYKAHIQALRVTFDYYASLEHRPQSAGGMSVPAWYDFLCDCEAFDERFVKRKTPVAFVYGQMWHIDEVTTERHMHMNFVEFLVAIGAVVYMRHLWHEEEFADLLEEFIDEQIMPVMEEKLADHEQTVLAAGRPMPQKAMRSNFQKVFKIADEDGDGTLTLREFRNAFRNPKVVAVLGGKDCGADDFGRVFDALDADHNHVLNVEEALRGFEAFRTMELTSNRAHAFLAKICEETAAHSVDGLLRVADIEKMFSRSATQRKLMRIALDPDTVRKFLHESTEPEREGFSDSDEEKEVKPVGDVTFGVEDLTNALMKIRTPKIIPKWKVLMKQVFEEADVNDGGSICKGEWKAAIQYQSIVTRFEKCGVGRHMLEGLFATLDADGSNDLTEHELLEGVEGILASGVNLTDVSADSRKGNRAGEAARRHGSQASMKGQHGSRASVGSAPPSSNKHEKDEELSSISESPKSQRTSVQLKRRENKRTSSNSGGKTS
jgi:Ca2+-binding EF-hand superfamily protein